MSSLRQRFLSRPSLEELKELERRKPLFIQERDIQILRLLYEHRLMNLRQLEELLGMKTEGRKQVLRERMRQLYCYHLLDQPEDSLYLRLKYRDDPEYNTSLYGIASRGITTLARELGWDLEKAQRKRTNERYFLFLQHSLFISRFYTLLELALRKREDFRILGWKQGQEIETKLRQVSPSAGYRLETKAERPSLRPDAFFCLHNQEKEEVAFFFLEADLSGQQRLSTMVDKFRKYWEFWKQGLYQSFGIDRETGFQVLTFCRHEERVRTLLETFDSHLPWRELPRERKPNMFCFAYDSHWSSYKDPEWILGKIWVSPRRERFSLLD